MKPPIKISTIQENGLYQASKWQKITLFVSYNELKKCLQSLQAFTLHPLGVICEGDQLEISLDAFLNVYAEYIDSLQARRIPNQQLIKEQMTLALTVDKNQLYAIEVPSKKYLLRVIKPVIQIVPHTISFSRMDYQFHSNVMGMDTIQWGIQISYPQLFQDPLQKKTVNALLQKNFPDAHEFKKIQHWMRENTVPTIFSVDDKRIVTPFRIGKECLDWINIHPELLEKNITVIS